MHVQKISPGTFCPVKQGTPFLEGMGEHPGWAGSAGTPWITLLESRFRVRDRVAGDSVSRDNPSPRPVLRGYQP
jgi:hypothetical protein